MNKVFFIGVDGGGTKTNAIVTDADLKILGAGMGGPSNIRLSVDNSWVSINSAVNEALNNAGLNLSDNSCNFHIGLGLAGVSIKKAKDEFLSKKHNFKTLILESDAHIACLAYHNGRDGAILSIGTGVIGYAVLKNKSYRIGGWGFPHADTGGGAWIGMEALRYTFSWIDKCIDGSELLENIYSKFNNNSMDMVAWANNSNSSNFASITPLVIESLEKKDPYAIKLFQRAGAEMDSNLSAIKNFDNTIVYDCFLVGGLAKYIMPFLKSVYPKLPHDAVNPALGAVYMIKQYLNKKN